MLRVVVRTIPVGDVTEPRLVCTGGRRGSGAESPHQATGALPDGAPGGTKMSRTTRIAAAIAAVLAVAAPTASAMPANGPDASVQPRDSVQTSSLAGTTSTVDRRSPDVRDATIAPRQDLR